MSPATAKPGLIHSRRETAIALGLTGFVTVLSLRTALSNSHYQSGWLIDLGYLLPMWAVATVNIAFYAYLLWLGIVFYRGAQGKERFVVGGWFIGILLSGVQHLFSMPVSAIAEVRAFGMVVAFLAALEILVRKCQPIIVSDWLNDR